MKYILFMITAVTALFFGMNEFAYAQEAAAAAPGVADKIGSVIDKLIAILGIPTFTLVGGFLIDLILKRFPTKNPVGILVAVKGSIGIIKKILDKVEEGLMAVDAFIEKLIPQNLEKKK